MPDDWKQREARASGVRYMLIGAVLCLGGIALTVAGASSAAAASGGGRFLVFIGAIIGGFVMFFRGVVVFSTSFPDVPADKDLRRPLPPYVQNQVDMASKPRPRE